MPYAAKKVALRVLIAPQGHDRQSTVLGKAMPVITVYRHGVTAGTPPMRNDHVRAKRGEVKGWSPGAVRRNLKFLYSIDERSLTGEGWALTLTVRKCPPSYTDWKEALELYFLQVKRLMGTVRVHWVTEWQRRGVPHLHAAIWLPEGTSKRFAVENILTHLWVAYGAHFGVSLRGQRAKPIDGPIGWFQYVSKHAARGAKHYQRSSENIPQGWEKTGRMWGTGGDWPTKEPVKLQTDNSGYHVLRRWARAWRISNARSGPESVETRRRISSARTMLRCPDLQLSRVRGISEWIEEDLLLRMLQRLALDGYLVES